MHDSGYCGVAAAAWCCFGDPSWRSLRMGTALDWGLRQGTLRQLNAEMQRCSGAALGVWVCGLGRGASTLAASEARLDTSKFFFFFYSDPRTLVFFPSLFSQLRRWLNWGLAESVLCDVD